MITMGITDSNFTYLWLLVLISNTLQIVPLFLLNLVNIEKITESVNELQNKDNK